MIKKIYNLFIIAILSIIGFLLICVLTLIQLFIIMPIYYVKTGRNYMIDKDPWALSILNWLYLKLKK